MKAYRASLLYFSGRQAMLEQDGLLVVGPDASGRQVVQAMGSYPCQVALYPDLVIEHNRNDKRNFLIMIKVLRKSHCLLAMMPNGV